MVKWTYGDGWERFPVEPGELWTEQITGSCVAVHDLFDGLPRFMLDADMIYTDSPWNTGNLRGFYTKANQRTDKAFGEFSSMLFEYIAAIRTPVCYLEIGKQNVDNFVEKMKTIYPVVQQWSVTYYKRNLSFLIRGGYDRQQFDFTGYDDMNTPRLAMENEQFSCVADLCMGRGLTAITAFALGKRFVGTELNKRRLAVTVDKIDKAGGIWLITQH